eukprot:UN23227
MLKQRSGPGCCVFKTCKIYIFDTLVLGQFLSDFVRVKSNVPPRSSTFTYPIFEKFDFRPNYPFNMIGLSYFYLQRRN